MSKVPTSKSKTYEHATSRISQSRKWITIVFTDIVDSTRHWDEMGDVETRYRMEQHNQILLPLVPAYAGEVVKTIGDSIMASFEDPENAVRSAIAMQHALHEIREKDPEFQLKVRIGIHRGRALVEQDDVFGNTVNVAARVEEQAQGDEILISDSVVSYLDQERYFLSRRGSFTPRGKTNSILLYRVSWWRTESVLAKVPKHHAAPLLRRLCEMILYPICAAAGLIVSALELAPALLESRPGWQSIALNPSWTFENYREVCLTALGLLVLSLALPLFARATRLGWLRRLRVAVAFFAGFAMLQFAAQSVPIDWPGEFRHVLEVKGESLVEVRASELGLRRSPARDAPVVAQTRPGQGLPLVQSAQTKKAGPWLRVALVPGQYGWLPAEKPGAGGQGEIEIVPARFRVLEPLDLYAALWGALLSLAVWAGSRRGDARHRPASV